jgi:hypothetical protein
MLTDQIEPPAPLPVHRLPESLELAGHDGGRFIKGRTVSDEALHETQLGEV